MELPQFCWPDVKQTILMARRLQPDVLMRNRGIGAYGDYHTPENWIPDSPESRESKLPWMEIRLLGYRDPLPWRWDEEGLMISLPGPLQAAANRPCQQAYAFQIEGVAAEVTEIR